MVGDAGRASGERTGLACTSIEGQTIFGGMKTVGKLALLVVLLNVVRYTVGGFLESFTIMEPMHLPMTRYPDAFDSEFTSNDFMISLVYNYAMWFFAAVVFHLLNPVLRGSIWVRSLKSYMLVAAIFCSVAAIYMNHYVAGVKPFYFWSMVDALILFPVVALANALLYPRFFRRPIRGVDGTEPGSGARATQDA